jgi:cell division inhibitor SepF
MGIFAKLKDLVGFSEPQEYEYEYDQAESDEYKSVYQEEPAPAPAVEEFSQPRRNRASALRTGMEGINNVIDMPGTNNGLSQVVVMEPRKFEEMPFAVQALRERKSIVLNLTMMEPDQAQRCVDFVAGATYAIDGHQERIGDSIFLFAPSCVQVTSQTSATSEDAAMPVRTTRPSTPTPSTIWASAEVPASRFAQ